MYVFLKNLDNRNYKIWHHNTWVMVTDSVILVYQLYIIRDSWSRCLHLSYLSIHIINYVYSICVYIAVGTRAYKKKYCILIHYSIQLTENKNNFLRILKSKMCLRWTVKLTNNALNSVHVICCYNGIHI